jgi:pSer/pThr/pTyr-binding forkhead associated (FHA) protein
MFTSAPSPPNLATSAPIAAPRSPVRPSRLRGLSYLRNYTHSHLHSRDTGGTSPTSSRNLTLTRATSYPSPTTGTTTNGASESVSTPSPRSPRPSPSIQRSAADSNSHIAAQDSTGNTSGWLPSTGGQSGVSRVAVLSGAGGTVEDIPYTADMGRTRSATTSRMAGADISSMTGGVDPQLQYSSTAPKSTSGFGASLPSIRFSQHQDIRAPRPSLVFSPMSRTLPTGKEVIRVGRYSEREQPPVTSASTPSAAAVGFKSKVVSRRHCEFWSEGGTWYIKDVKSSSGTFLNHVRLSSPGIESKPFAVKDGDIVQLGIDFKGGEEMIFRCVKIRVELNRNWQSALNSFK